MTCMDSLLSAKVMAVHIQTAGPEPHRHRLRLIQLAVPECPVVAVDAFSVLPEGKPLLKRILEGPAVKVFHNAKTALSFLLAEDIQVENLFDTMLAAQLLRSSGGPCKADLDTVCRHYLPDPVPQAAEMGGAQTAEGSREELESAVETARALLKLRDAMIPELYANGLNLIAKIEFDCAKAITQMEYHGVWLDLARWEEERCQMEKVQRAALKELYTFAEQPAYQLTFWGDEVALNAGSFDSNPYVIRLLKQNGIDVTSTDKQHLLPYADHPLVRALSAYRKSSKAMSSFLYPIPVMIDSVTGRLHPKYDQIGASSGRMSCGGPNIQQIPREQAFRRCFCAPKGKKLVIADYSQIELRVAACISGDKRMMEAYQKGEDLHTLTAALICGTSVGSVTKAQRQAAKAVNFGLIFGMGAAGLAAYARQSYGVDMTQEQAAAFRERFFKAYPGISAWHQRIAAAAPTEERTLTGRKFTFRKNAGLSGLYNTPVQGTAADIAKAALGDLVRRLKHTGTKIIAIVHDEILLEADAQDAEAAAAVLKSAMELAGERILRGVPCVADVKIVDDWAEK